MTNEQHLRIFKRGTAVWNRWREENPKIVPDLADLYHINVNLHGINLQGSDLRRANLARTNLTDAILSKTILFSATLTDAVLSKADLRHANLVKVNCENADLSGANLVSTNFHDADISGATLAKANLSDSNLSHSNLFKTNLHHATLVRANLHDANLSKANLTDADLLMANLSHANVTDADLSRANLSDANLTHANFSRADLSGASLTRAILVDTKLEKANLTGCSIYGISAWGLELEGAKQSNLIITRDDEPSITVDSLEVAQFIHLLLSNRKIRDVIDTITSKVVLILGRFTPERIVVLDALRNELRHHKYLPIVFDFEKPANRDLTETIVTLAHMSRFIIADLTHPNSVPHELASIIPTLRSVPIQPMIESSQREYGMFADFSRSYNWVLPIYRYKSVKEVLTSIEGKIIAPAEAKVKELRSH